MVKQVHRVKTSDLQVGVKVERSEHPWASERVAKRLARDHLQQNPDAYSGGCGGGSRGGETVVVLNQNVRAISPRKKKKPASQQDQAQSNAPGWIPQNLRMWG